VVPGCCGNGRAGLAMFANQHRLEHGQQMCPYGQHVTDPLAPICTNS
jgi:hypothetical protein